LESKNKLKNMKIILDIIIIIIYIRLNRMGIIPQLKTRGEKS